MKKKISIIVLLILSITFITLFVIVKKTITVNKNMLSEENHMESAWDFKQNLNIGWNLGMSLSTNIKYSQLITYSVIINDEKFGDFKPELLNSFNVDNYTNDDLKIEFNIPYTNLDGILYWSLDELKINNNIICQKTKFETKVNNGKAIEIISNLDYKKNHKVEIRLTISKLYEYDTSEKVDFYETFWCHTKTTKELIQTLRKRGFNAIRISFDVYNHLNNKGIIDSLWLNRLKEIVDYCMDENIYCLVDIVETYGLYVDDISNEMLNLYKSLWNQVANIFKDYDDKLLFSPFNEIRNKNGDWNTSNKNLLKNMNMLYQIFVDTIRSTGSNNKYRNLILTTYAAAIDELILNEFKIPKDVTYNHLLVESHFYQPVNFTFNEINLGHTNFINEWGSIKDKIYLNKTFKLLNDFIKKTKLPFIIGEFGVADRVDIKERIEYLSYYKKKAKQYKIGLFIFDDAHDFAIIDRNTYQFINDDLVDTLVF